MEQTINRLGDYTISKDAMLLDTNVLVAMFWKAESASRKDTADFILNEGRQLLIPVEVIVEAFGFIGGGKKDKDGAYAMLKWVLQPGTSTILNSSSVSPALIGKTAADLRIDYVDCVLAHLATELTNSRSIQDAILVATFDTRDFHHLQNQPNISFTLWDLRSNEMLPVKQW